jgi:myo-inositol-1(or 4)-monophosphatase
MADGQGTRPPDGIDAIHDAALALARETGEALQRYYATPLTVRYKSKREKDPVTEADEGIEALVRRFVADSFPHHGVLGEEGSDTAAAAEYLWVVDPLDGTANFANRLPLFAVSIGVLRFGSPVVAALYTTFGPHGRPCVLHAQRGGGLHLDGEPYRASEPATSGRARLAGVPAGFHLAFRYGRLIGTPPGETRSLGSIAVELGLVATGALQYAVFHSPRIWDVAAGVLLVVEGGGVVFTDRRARWRVLNRFEPPADKPLREWRQAVVAGDVDAVPPVLRRLHIRHRPAQWAERAIGPRRTAQLRDAAQRAQPVRRAAAALAHWTWKTARRIRVR